MVGPLWRTIRLYFHKLPLFYIHKLERPIIKFNRQVATLFNLLIYQSQSRDAELEELKKCISELEARVAKLEGRR
jgi:hypothetical protein